MSPVVAIAALLYVLAFVDVVVLRILAARAVRKADSPLPGDELPSGSLLARRLLEAEGLGAVQVIDADADAYRAASRELQLAAGRGGRASVAAWAIAAHEVGHAAQHRAGNTAWKRWWVLSGHTVWASLVLPVLLIAQLFVSSPVLVVASVLCLLVLVVSAVLSIAVERTAIAKARALLAGAGLPDAAVPDAERLLGTLAAAYVAESFLHTTWLDRVIPPLRG